MQEQVFGLIFQVSGKRACFALGLSRHSGLLSPKRQLSARRAERRFAKTRSKGSGFYFLRGSDASLTIYSGYVLRLCLDAQVRKRITDREVINDLTLLRRQVEIAVYVLVVKRADSGATEA